MSQKISNFSLFDDDNFSSLVSDSKQKEEIADTTTKSTRTISPSLIGSLLECPLCLWRHYNEGIKRPDGIFPSLPSGMDNIIKKYFDTYRTKNSIPPEISGNVQGTLFNDLKKLNTWRTNWQGISYNFKELNITLKGAIDELIILSNNEFVPFDFKTRGYPLKDDTHMHYQTQLDMYALLFNKNGYKVADYGYLLFFWPDEYAMGNTKFNTQLVKLNLDLDRGYSILKKAFDILNGPRPKAAENCQYCIYKAEK